MAAGDGEKVAGQEYNLQISPHYGGCLSQFIDVSKQFIFSYMGWFCTMQWCGIKIWQRM